MKRRGFLAVLLCLVLSMSMIPAAFADEGDADVTQDELVLVDEKVALEMGDRFFEGVTPDVDATTADPIKFFNKDGQAIGYVVHAYCDGQYYGYVIFDSEAEYGIAEFSYGENSTSPYLNVLERGESPKLRSTSSETRMYQIDPLTYCLIDETSGEGYDNYGESIVAEEYINTEAKTFVRSSPTPGSWNDVFLTPTDVYRNYNVVAGRSVSGYTMYSEAAAIADTGRYACGVTAMTTVCSYYTNINNFGATYNDLWTRSGTWVDHVTNGVSFGTTTTSNLGGAVRDFCAANGDTVNSNFINGAGWLSYRDCINRGDMAIFSAEGPGLAGHCMAVVGYMSLQDKNNYLAGINAINVYDGWSAIRILPFNPSQYSWHDGNFFTG